VSIAVANLVRNAFQYTTAGSVEICAQPGRVCVVDTGPGIESSFGASGLGLTIVKRLCERMGWSFTISDAPAGGTRAELAFQPKP
jgi:signal transduction histidine kinase